MKPLTKTTLRGLAIVTLCVVAVACRVDDLLQPHRGTLEYFAQNAFVESATVGSTTPRVDTIRINNYGSGELHWTAQVKHASPWLTLNADTGTVGNGPPLEVRADPTGLALGVYRDTIVVAATPTGPMGEVPVEFRIHQ